jgi:hypothetical protein
VQNTTTGGVECVLITAVAGNVSGSGTQNYLAKFYSGSTVGNSGVYDDGTNVGIGTASPGAKLDVNGNIKMSSASPEINMSGVYIRKNGNDIIITDG